ncbi:MFS transporter, partial [Bacillus safensis]|nr:MFS transporter [Bacillus safensis]
GSRVANMAAGPRRGLAQSIYQVGGNTGQAFAPLIAALMLVPLGQTGVAWFTIVGMMAVGFLLYISRWYAGRLQTIRAQAKKTPAKAARSDIHRKSALIALG